MIYSAGEGDQKHALILNDAEHDKLESGEVVKHRVSSQYGTFEIRVEMVMIEAPETPVGETYESVRLNAQGFRTVTHPSNPRLRNRTPHAAYVGSEALFHQVASGKMTAVEFLDQLKTNEQLIRADHDRIIRARNAQ